MKVGAKTIIYAAFWKRSNDQGYGVQQKAADVDTVSTLLAPDFCTASIGTFFVLIENVFFGNQAVPEGSGKEKSHNWVLRPTQFGLCTWYNQPDLTSLVHRSCVQVFLVRYWQGRAVSISSEWRANVSTLHRGWSDRNGMVLWLLHSPESWRIPNWTPRMWSDCVAVEKEFPDWCARKEGLTVRFSPG